MALPRRQVGAANPEGRHPAAGYRIVGWLSDPRLFGRDDRGLAATQS